MKNLTRDEARTRAALLTVLSYDITLDLTQGATHFGSTTTVRFTCAADAHADADADADADSFAELDGEVLSATLDGTSLDAGDEERDNRLPLRGLGGDHELVVHARCAYSHTGEGLHRFVDPADDRVYLYQQSFLDDAQRTFACFDQPDLKAPVTLTVEAPEGWTVVGNARGTRRGTRWSFQPTEPISPYLFTVAAGPWHTVTDEHDGISLGLHCRQSLAPHLETDRDELFTITRQCLDFQQEHFGRRYPFGDTYDQLFVPEFNAGAMENPGAVTFRDQFLFRSRVTDADRRERAEVIAHEMAHMWFGDLVTMRWWDDLWLNESFAELLGYLTVDRATRFTDVWVEFTTGRKAWGYRADQLPSTHPVQGDVADNRSALLNFDGISYAKGASVLRQLMATVGEDNFFQGVRAYIERHAFANTTFADLLTELEVASGRDLWQWSRAWLQSSGVSTLRITGGRLVQESDVVREHRLAVGVYDRKDQQLERRDRLTVDLAAEPVELPPGPAADLLLPNDGDLTFAKLRLDPQSLATAREHLSGLADPLARALIWGCLWDTCRDAELAPAAFVDAVVTHVRAEPDPAVTTTLLTQARTCATLFTDDADELRERLADACWQSAREVEPGSDLQLTYVRAAASTAPAAHLPRVRALLENAAVPAGLTVDTELRWHLVTCLAGLGGTDAGAIEAELARDDSAAGRLHALTARAALPGADHKAWAWSVAGDPDRSAYEVRAVADGFWRTGQQGLLAPYVYRYAAVLPNLWGTRGPEVAGILARWLFPSTMVEPWVLEATAPLLDEHHPPGLRRFVADGRDDLARALRVRVAR